MSTQAINDASPEEVGEFLTINPSRELTNSRDKPKKITECFGENHCTKSTVREISTILSDGEHLRFQLERIETDPLAVIENALKSYTHIEYRTSEINDDITLCDNQRTAMLNELVKQRNTTDDIVTKLIEDQHSYTEQTILEMRQYIEENEVATDKYFDAALNYLENKISHP